MKEDLAPPAQTSQTSEKQEDENEKPLPNLPPKKLNSPRLSTESVDEMEETNASSEGEENGIMNE